MNVMNDYGAAAIHYVMTHCTLPTPPLVEKLLQSGTDPNIRTYVSIKQAVNLILNRLNVCTS